MELTRGRKPECKYFLTFSQFSSFDSARLAAMFPPS